VAIKTYIPIRTTDILDPRVERAIVAQSLGAEIELVWNTPVSTCKRKGEFEGRDKIRELVKSGNNDIVVLNDSDIRHLFVDNFKCQFDYLSSNKDVGVVGLWSRRIPLSSPLDAHVKMQCTMWRKEVLVNMPLLDFEGSNYNCCHCMRYKQAVEAMGFKMVYLDGMRRIIEIN
jgi:hypothetical protein